MQRILMRATKHNLFSAKLSICSQPNRSSCINSAWLNSACITCTNQTEDIRATKQILTNRPQTARVDASPHALSGQPNARHLEFIRTRGCKHEGSRPSKHALFGPVHARRFVQSRGRPCPRKATPFHAVRMLISIDPYMCGSIQPRRSAGLYN